MSNKIAKLAVGLSAVGLAMSGLICHAAADSDLTSGFASSTAIATDNKGLIISYIVSIFLVVLVIGIAKAGLNWGLRKITGAFGGGKRRR